MDVKNDVLARITEPSNNDYNNDVNDNCDHNFGTFKQKKSVHVCLLDSMSNCLSTNNKRNKEITNRNIQGNMERKTKEIHFQTKREYIIQAKS